MKCVYCGEEFEGRHRKYCSPECRKEADKENKRIKYVGKRESVCRQCGCELPKYKTRFCSASCCELYNHIKSGAISHPDILVKICPVCGVEFKTWKSRQQTCSAECANYKHQHRTDRDERIKAAMIDDDIDLMKLYKRDHGQCQLCGLMTNFEDYQMKGAYKICGNMYPSIDHIKPISKGGLHSWDNIQLAHRRCNSSKGNR